MNLIIDWAKKHWSSIAIGLLLCWISIGVTYTTFIRPSIKADNYIAASDGLQPTFGCASGRQFLGWAHHK